MPRSILLVPSLAAIAAVLAGCQTSSVIRTTPIASADNMKGRPYLVYPLAETLLVITVKKAGGGGDDKPKAEPTNANTITIQNWLGGQKPDPEKKEEAEQAPCDAIRDAYKDQVKVRGKLLAAYLLRKRTVEALWLPDPGASSKPDGDSPAAKLLSDPTEQQTILDSLEAQAKAAKDDAASLKVAKSLAKNFGDLSCKTAVSIEVSQKIVADPTRTMALYLNDSDYSADKLTVKLDANGFPTSITSSADDKSGEVVTGALKSIASVVGFAQGVPDLSGLNSMQALGADPGGLSSLSSRFGVKLQQLDVFGTTPGGVKIRPTPQMIDKAFRDKVRPDVEKLLEAAPETLPALDPPLPDLPLQLLIGEVNELKAGDGSMPEAREWLYRAIYGAYGYRIACAPVRADIPFTPSTGSLFRIKDEVGEGEPGLIVSGQRSCEVQVLKVKNWKTGDEIPDFKTLKVDEETAGAEIVNRTFFLATDPRMQQVIPISRTSLIARSDGYEFVDGRMTSVTYDKPSNALAAVSLPFKATGDVISGLSTAVQGQQGLIKAQSDLVTAKANQTKADAEIYNAQAALLKAQTDLLAAQAAADKARKDQQAAGSAP